MFRTVTDIGREIGESGETVRYWSDFLHLKPSRSPGGWRHFTPEKESLLKQFHQLVRGEGYTLAGAKKRLDGAR